MPAPDRCRRCRAPSRPAGRSRMPRDDPESVAHPLDRGPGDEDAALRARTAARRRCPTLRSTGVRARERRLRSPCSSGRTSRCRRCSSPSRRRSTLVRRAPPADRRRPPRSGSRAAQDAGAVSPKRPLDGRTSGRSAAGIAELFEDPVVPAAVFERIEHRARRVRGLGHMHLAAGQVPDEPRVDGSEGELARPRPRRAARRCSPGTR